MEQTFKQFLKQADKVRYDPPCSSFPSDIYHIETSYFPSQISTISKLLTNLESLDLKSLTWSSNFDCASFLVSQTLKTLQVQIKQVLIDEENHDPLILAISKLPCLKVLCLDVHQLSKIDFKLISSMSQLIQLQLTNLQPITEESLKLLANLKNLQCFGLMYEEEYRCHIDPTEIFFSLPFLTSLSFSFLQFTPSDIMQISRLTKLTNLHLEYCLSYNLLIYEGLLMLKLIGLLKELLQLDISGFLLQNEGFFIIREYPHLKTLHVNDCELSLEDIEAISRFPVLQELIAYNNFIDLQCILILSENKPDLKRLEFSFSPDIQNAKEFSLIIMKVALSFKDLEVLKMDLDDNEDKGFERFCLNSGLVYLRKLKKLRQFQCSCYVPQMYMMLKSVMSCKQLKQFNLHDLYNLDDTNEELRIRTNKQDIRRVMDESKLFK